MSACNGPDGTLLDRRYRLLRVVGGGRTGRVYRALHVGLGAVVALKEMHAPAGSEARAAFFRDARALTALGHPNLPRVRDYFGQGDSCFLVSDFVEGETLDTLMRRLGPLPLRTVLSYGLQLCGVLVYLHRGDPPLLLGDLEPSDVVITDEGRAVLVDLGLARRLTSSPAAVDPGPGLARLAELLRELLVGDATATAEAAVPAHLDLPPELAQLLARALVHSADGRIASAGELGQALQAAGRALLPSLATAAADAAPHAAAALGFVPIVAPGLGADPVPGPSSAPTMVGRSGHLSTGAARRAPHPPWRRIALGVGATAASLAVVAAVAITASLAAVGPPSRAQVGPPGRPFYSGSPPGATPPALGAASTLAGPPSRPNPPVLRAGRVIPPTPTPVPTATPWPPTPTATPGDDDDDQAAPVPQAGQAAAYLASISAGCQSQASAPAPGTTDLLPCPAPWGAVGHGGDHDKDSGGGPGPGR